MTEIDEQLTKYLTDAHSIEEQALAQLRSAPDIAGDEQLARIFHEHLLETEDQERLIRERLEAHGASPSRLKDTVMAAGGKGFVLFAKSQPDTPGKLAAHGAKPNALQDAAMRLGALNWGMFFQAQPDTPGKLAAFAYAFEHLEIGGYEQLKRVAERAGDQETVQTAERILSEEREAARKIAAQFDRAATASLEAVG